MLSWYLNLVFKGSLFHHFSQLVAFLQQNEIDTLNNFDTFTLLIKVYFNRSFLSSISDFLKNYGNIDPSYCISSSPLNSLSNSDRQEEWRRKSWEFAYLIVEKQDPTTTIGRCYHDNMDKHLQSSKCEVLVAYWCPCR
jgi:hypothetical protein